jgi:hypothetical protein
MKRPACRSLRSMLVLALLLPLATGCATGGTPVPDRPKSVKGHGIAPYALHEECMKLAPGDRLEYHFDAGAPLHFNIHYHEGKAVVMPISRDGVRSDGGVFQPRAAHDYCLMWEAGAAGTMLDYHIVLRRGSR